MNLVRQIRKAAVLGSGVMGSGIAAHLANIGIPTLLLDIVPRELTEEEKKKGLTLDNKQVRNRISQTAITKLLKQKPAPLSAKGNIALIEAGNLEDDISRLKDVDWIIEVVVEKLEVKQVCSPRLISIVNQEASFHRIPPEFQLKRWQKAVRRTFKSTFWEPTSSIRRVILSCWSSSQLKQLHQKYSNT